MSGRTTFSRIGILSCVLCLAAAGCAPSYPYYTVEGTMESRVVVIHLGENSTERVPAGSGMGAGLTEGHRMMLQAGEPAIIEKGSARVTITGVMPQVSKVEYDGQEVPYHKPVL